MHGVKKDDIIEARKSEKQQKKIAKYRSAMDIVISKSYSQQYDDAGLAATADAISVSAENHIVWAYRRRYLLQNRSNRPPDDEFDTKCLCQLDPAAAAAELNLLEQCIRNAPKCYWVWFQRRWVCERTPDMDWTRELKLCSLLLQLDARNFHCWGYRRFVAGRAGVSPESELAYSGEKVAENFSNYSAWHQRSVLLPQIHQDPQELLQAVKDEMDLVHNALFVDPADESAWVYHRWALDTALQCAEGAAEKEAVVEAEAEAIGELVEAEPECVRALRGLLEVEMRREKVREEVVEDIKQKLRKLDITHAERYV